MRLLYAVLVSAACIQAEAVMRGKVVRNRLDGESIVAVRITAPGVANPTLSRDDGTFTLQFPNRPVGDRVTIELTHPGFEVVNWPQLKGVVLALDYQKSNVLVIILAPAADRLEMAGRFYLNVSLQAIERQYQQRLQQAGEDKTKLSRELVQTKALWTQTAQELAKLQPGQSSPLYEDAMKLIAEGKIEEALEVLNEANLIKMTQAAKEAAARPLREAARGWALRGSLLATKFRFAEAEAAYREAVETAPDDFDRRFEFAYFLQNLNRHQAAREQYERCLSLARPQPDSVRIAMTLNNLGNLHSDQNRMEAARKAYEEALGTYRKLAASNPDTYLPYVARVLSGMGRMHLATHNRAEAGAALAAALEIYSKFAELDPEQYGPFLRAVKEDLAKVSQ